MLACGQWFALTSGSVCLATLFFEEEELRKTVVGGTGMYFRQKKGGGIFL